MATRAHRLKFIDRLFVMMHVTYGHLWSSLFASDQVLQTAKGLWAMQLHPWSEEQVERVMDRCRRVYVERPPTLPQFLNLLRTDRMHDEYKSLPAPPCDEQKAKREIQAMREAIRRAP